MRITKGKALILARMKYGPSTHVQLRGQEHVILKCVGGDLISSGTNWAQALKETK